MTALLLITALTVSVDSFACGLGLSLGKKRNFLPVPVITATVFIMCLIAHFAAIPLSAVLTEKVASFGGLILIGTGVFGLFKREKDDKTRKGLWDTVLVGFAVGLDGACADLSLALMGLDGIIVPVVIALMHALAVFFGILLSGAVKKSVMEKIGFLSPAILIAIGVYKIVSAFIWL